MSACYSNARSQFLDAQNGVQPRIAVELEPFADRRLLAGCRLQLRWREFDSSSSWEYGQPVSIGEYVLHTAALVEGLVYDVEVISRSPAGSTLGCGGGRYDAGTTVIQHTIGRAISMADLWFIAVSADIREFAVAYGENELSIQSAVHDGSSWSNWETMFTLSRPNGAPGGNFKIIYGSVLRAFVGTNVRVRVQATSGSGRINYGDIGLFFKSLQR